MTRSHVRADDPARRAALISAEAKLFAKVPDVSPLLVPSLSGANLVAGAWRPPSRVPRAAAGITRRIRAHDALRGFALRCSAVIMLIAELGPREMDVNLVFKEQHQVHIDHECWVRMRASVAEDQQPRPRRPFTYL